MMPRRESDQSERTVQIDPTAVTLEGDLVVPRPVYGVVLFAHGSGSSRHSERNRYVARQLRQEGFATLLLDLLTADEELIDLHTRHLRFDVDLLAARLIGATDWLRHEPVTRRLPIGYFGASTGAGAALVAAAVRSDDVAAVGSGGGRPDLAGKALIHVRAPTLPVVGGDDTPGVEINRQALTRLRCGKEMRAILGATDP